MKDKKIKGWNSKRKQIKKLSKTKKKLKKWRLNLIEKQSRMQLKIKGNLRNELKK